MKFLDVQKNINEKVLPVYIVTGTDAFLIKQTISIFKKTLLKTFEELNFHFFDNENYNAQNILNACNGMPFANDLKLVVTHLPETLSKDDQNAYMQYVQNPNHTTVFLMVSNAKEMLALNAIEQIACDKLDRTNLQKLIASRLKNNNKTINIDAANLLIEKCDSDTMRITNELEKLSFYSDEGTITKEMVDDAVTNSFDLNVFNLTNALALKNADTTLGILKDMLEAKQEPSSIFRAIANNFRRMFLVSISTNMSNEEIATELKVKPFAVAKAKENAHRFSVKNLKRINELLQEIEHKFKSGKMTAINSIYYLIFNIFVV